MNVKNIDRKFANFLKTKGEAPLDAFEGYSARELMPLLEEPFSPGSVLTLNKLTDEEILEVPIVRSALFLLQTIKESGGQIELTNDYTLPTEIVTKLFNHANLKRLIHERNHPDPVDQLDSYIVTTPFAACLASELVEFKSCAASLTDYGEKALGDLNYLLDSVIKAFLSIGFWSFLEEEDADISIVKFGYLFMLLHRYGTVSRVLEFYYDHFLIIFIATATNRFAKPEDNEYVLFIFRVFYVMLPLLGVANIDLDKEGRPDRVSTNELFRKIFSCKPPQKAHKIKTNFAGLGLE